MPLDWLSTHNSSSSADFILPTLIYTLIISPPTQDFNIISNLFFIQRFRAKKAIDGEAAYCLTNLEAAISFLETVELATLKVEDPNLQKRPNSRSRSRSSTLSHPVTPPYTPAGDPLASLSEKSAMASTTAATLAPQNTVTSAAGSNSSGPASVSQQSPGSGSTASRRLSYLTPIDLATSAVSTADQGIRGIGSTLESSYKFLFGKMEKRGEELPKTLEEVRKLVNSPTPGSLEHQQGKARSDVPASAVEVDRAAGTGGMKRVDSTASIGSAHSGKRTDERDHIIGGLHKAAAAPVAAAETVMNLGTSLGRFAVRGFTRSTTPTVPATNTDSATSLKGLGISGDDKVSKGHKREDSAPVADLLSVCLFGHGGRVDYTKIGDRRFQT